MQEHHYNQALALSGVFQAAHLAERLARSGLCPQDTFEASVSSVFALEPDSAADVYGGEAGVRAGAQLLAEILGSREAARRHTETISYSLALLHLHKRLTRRDDLMSALRKGLEQCRTQAQHFGDATHENVLGGLAQLYLDTLGTFKFRIQIKGEARHLQSEQNANRIRAALLAGVRSAQLWRQLGGRRWHLLVTRKPLLEALGQLSRSG